MGLRNAIVAGVAAFVMAPSVAIATSTRAEADGATRSSGRPGSVLVRLEPGVSAEAAGRIARDHGVRLIRPVEGTGFLLFSAGSRPVDAVAAELAGDGRIETAEPNHVRRVAAVPNDPYFPGSQAAALNLVRLPEAWNLSTGSDDLILAVVDSGVKANHPDLAGRLLPGRDFVNGDDNPDDDHGHGTQVATVAAATGNDGRGMAGVVWRGKVLPVKVIDQQGDTTDADVAAGIRWAVDHGADVINLSFGGVQSATKVVRDAIGHAHAHDVVVVAAAGNNGATNPIYPAALDGVVAVAATDRFGRLAPFSDSGSWIDLAAPGADILVGSRDGGYLVTEGTSFAAPLVAGVAMLARARFPHETADQIVRRLQLGATDTGPLGPDDIYGYGVVDALGTLTGSSRRLSMEAALLTHEPDNTPERATAVALGGSATAHLAPEQDVDWYSVDITASRRHTFTVAPTTAGSTMEPVLAVYDAGLDLLRQVGADRHHTAQVELYTATPGRYHVRIQNRTATAAIGPYTLTVRPVDGPAQTSFITNTWDYRGSGASAAAIADFTGNGTTDVLLSGAKPPEGAQHHELTLWPEPLTNYVPVKIPTHRTGSTSDFGLAVTDADRDGDDDAVLATSDGLEIYQQIDGTLRRSTLVATGGPVSQVEAGDVNGDGIDDLVATRTGGGITVVLNQGAAAFSAPVEVSSIRAAEIEVADLDGDGRHEIVALECDPACRTVAVHRFALNGFRRSSTELSGSSPCGAGGAIGVGKVTGDGRLDLFASCAGIDGIHLLSPDGTGELQRRPLVDLDFGTAAVALEAADIDGDGRDEILALHDQRKVVSALWIWPDGRLGDLFDLGALKADRHGPKGLAVGDLNNDTRPDLAVAGWDQGHEWVMVTPVIPGPVPDGQMWIRDTYPAHGSTNVAADVIPTVRFAPPITPGSVSPATVRLTDVSATATVPASLTFDATTNSISIRPEAPLQAGRTYEVATSGLNDTRTAAILPDTQCCYRFAVRDAPSPPPPGGGQQPPPDPPVGSAQTHPARSGYWMLDGAGTVYHFGDAAALGNGAPGAVDLEPTPTGKGYWILNPNGVVADFGDASRLGNVDVSTLARDEMPASLSATPSGKGYWVFTSRGRAIAFGDAAHLGDMSQVKLNGPVLGSVATPTGRGYYMVASDGGIFAFGDAAFAGSMGGTELNAPVQSLVPDADGNGYWLVASDGGIFAFEAPFRGSMGATKLNKPVVGMVRYGDGYLMVGADGGIFNFSALPFSGSLGDKPPAAPVVAVAALP